MTKISVEKCRRILKDNGYEGLDEMTDDMIKELRDKLYEFAELQVEEEELQARDREAAQE